MDLSIKNVMTSKNLNTTEVSDLDNAESVLKSNKIEKLPVVDNNYKLIGLITFKDIIKIGLDRILVKINMVD